LIHSPRQAVAQSAAPVVAAKPRIKRDMKAVAAMLELPADSTVEQIVEYLGAPPRTKEGAGKALAALF
jgi:hypothetical protein